MDNEATKILNPQQSSVQNEEPAVQETQETLSSTNKKESAKSNFIARSAATAAGAAIGTSAALAAEHAFEGSTETEEEAVDAVNEEEQAIGAAVGQETLTNEHQAQESQAAPKPTNTTNTTDNSAQTEAPVTQQQTVHTNATAPTEQEAIVATDEGLRVAQVDDSLSFSQAFAEARAQVGAGGVFEWNGKVYSTYYEEEWDSMSAAERAEWQSKVDYSDVTDVSDSTASTSNSNSGSHAGNAAATTASIEEPMAADSSYIDENSSATDADNEVHVVGVAIQENGQGGVATLAGLQSGDDMAILVDVDSDGRIDLIAVDENNDGQLSENEVHDISGENIATANVIGTYVDEANQSGNTAVVTDLDSGNQYQITESETGYGMEPLDSPGMDDNMYMASNDDMPDYMNDADTSFMDA